MAFLAQGESGEVRGELARRHPRSPDAIDDTGSIGVRFGDNISPRFNIAGSLSYFSPDGNLPDGRKLDYDAFIAEISFGGTFRPKKNVRPILFAGIGWAFVNGDVTGAESSTVEALLRDGSLLWSRLQVGSRQAHLSPGRRHPALVRAASGRRCGCPALHRLRMDVLT